jgi:hypothetical protein
MGEVWMLWRSKQICVSSNLDVRHSHALYHLSLPPLLPFSQPSKLFFEAWRERKVGVDKLLRASECCTPLVKLRPRNQTIAQPACDSPR